MNDPRLLLADEDDAARTFLTENLTADGYHVEEARDRDEALQRLRTSTPDLILADVNGRTLGLLDWLRTADGTFCAAATDTPVIVLSSHGNELSQAGFRGDFERRTFCPPVRRFSSDATTMSGFHQLWSTSARSK
jgi:CheY-like chemotaxis protein